jgi:hypothetical protein
VGKEDREMVSASRGRSQSGGSRGAGSSTGQSVSWQERSLVRLQDTITLETGEFIGQTVETEQPFFQGKVERQAAPGSYPLHPLATFEGGPAPQLEPAPVGEGHSQDWVEPAPRGPSGGRHNRPPPPERRAGRYSGQLCADSRRRGQHRGPVREHPETSANAR